MKKRMLSLILALTMLLQFPAEAYGETASSGETCAEITECAEQPEQGSPETEPAQKEDITSDKSAPETSDTNEEPDETSSLPETDEEPEEPEQSVSESEPAEEEDIAPEESAPEASDTDEEKQDESSAAPTETDDAEKEQPETSTPDKPEGESSEPESDEPSAPEPAEPVKEGALGKEKSENEESAAEPEKQIYSGSIYGSDVYWEYSDGCLIISGSGGCRTFGSKEEQPWGEVREQIYTVRFSNAGSLSIENIAYWFDGCVSMTGAQVPYTTKIIGTRAFADCVSLGRINLPYSDMSAVSIAEDAFANCPAQIKTSAPLKATGCDHEWWEMEYYGDVCTGEGTVLVQCIHCGNTYTTSAGPLGHAYDNTYEYADESGHNKTSKCSRCGDETSEYEEHHFVGEVCSECRFLKHPYAVTDTKAPTCTEAGWKLWECGVCGDKYKEEIAATGHTYLYSYESLDYAKHKVTKSCLYGDDTQTYEEAHNFETGVCRDCSCLQYPNPGDLTLSMSGHGNGKNTGTGYISLSWNTVENAEKYYVCLFNGKEYEYIDVGNVTSWSSKGKGLWPTQEEISAGRYKLHLDGTGAELSAVPSTVYANGGTEHASDLNYYAAVIPANSNGYMPVMLEKFVKSAQLPDTVPPGAPEIVTADPAEYTNKNRLQISWAGIREYDGNTVKTDLAPGGVQYKIDNGSWQNTGVTVGDGSFALDVSSLTDGTHVVYIRARDKDGNTGTGKSTSIYIDRTAPERPELTVSDTDWTNAGEISFSWCGITDLNPLKSVEYSLDNGEYTDTDFPEETHSGYVLDIRTLPDGEHSIALRATDTVGNTGKSSSVIFRKDTAAPAYDTLSVQPESWTNSGKAVISWTGLTDAHSGVASAWYSIDGGEQVSAVTDNNAEISVDVSGLDDGKHTVAVAFEDKVGNRTEASFDIYTDATAPELGIINPADGAEINGNVEVYIDVDDQTLKSWKLSVNGEEILAEGTKSVDSASAASFNCKDYDDGEKLIIVLSAEDEAGNTAEKKISLTVNKSMIPLPAGISVTSPVKGDTVTVPVFTGQCSSTDGFVYTDGIYTGEVKDGKFSFDAIRYAEKSSHTISIIAPDSPSGPLFTDGLAEYLILSDSFDEESGENFLSEAVSPARPVLALRFESTGDAGTYTYTTDGGGTWTEIHSGDFIALRSAPVGIQIRAEGGKSPGSGYTLYGVTELSPLAVSTELFKKVGSISTFSGTTRKAYTELGEAPKGSKELCQYIDGELAAQSFTLDSTALPEDSRHNTVLLAVDKDGKLYGSGAKAETVRRENLSGNSAETGKLSFKAPVYAIRIEALSEGSAKYYCSADNKTWTELSPGKYTVLEKSSKELYFKAEGKGLSAWHIEAVSSAGSSVYADLISDPVNVAGTDYGGYYANEKLWRYDLRWTDAGPEDSSAKYTLLYDVYRNGALIATVSDTRYTDYDYIPWSDYAVRAVRDYGGTRHGGGQVEAGLYRPNAPKKPENVINIPEEQKQSEYLNALYGGDYTFSGKVKTPYDENREEVFGKTNICAYGLEPVNIATGNFYLSTEDYTAADMGLAEFSLSRTYNAQGADKNGPFGMGWESGITSHLTLYENGDVVYHDPGGAGYRFTKSADGYTGGSAGNLSLRAKGSEFIVTDSEENETVFSSAGLLKRLLFHDGNEITYLRDGDGFLTGIRLPGGRTVKITMDRQGHITELVTPGGSTLRYGYTGSYLTSVTDAAGNTVRYVYDAMDRMTEWYDGNGVRQVKNEYDSKSRVVKQTDANGGVSELEYHEEHTVVTDAAGNVSEVWFDEAFHTTKTVDALGGVVLYDYDEDDNIIAITDENGNTTRYEYDSAGRKTKETAPDGTFYTLDYDENGNLEKLTDRNGAVTTYEYDDENRLVRETAPDGGETLYEYNADRQLTKLTDALGGVTEYVYDGVNLISSTDANGNTTSYEYDSENRLAATTDALGHKTQFAYDSLGNLIKVTFADGSSFTYEYSPAGKLLSTTDALGIVTAYEYDALGNLTKTTDANGNDTTNTYDHNGNAVKTVDALGAEVTAEYDPQGHLMSVTDSMGNTTRYEYDKAGNLVKETNALGGETKYAYDAAGQLTAVTTPAGDTTSYTYDAAGRLHTVTAPNGGVTAYEYDSMGRKTADIDPNGGRTEYTYDVAGRITKASDANGSETSYTYDAVGNVLSVTDALGNTTEYSYDALGRTATLTDPNGGVTGYEYDVTGNLIAQTDAEGNVTSYEYDA